jgi:hypothetical protein
MHLATKADVPFINSVVNHPKVRPHIWFGDHELDCTESIELMWTLVVPGKGVMMAEALGDGNYLGLTAFLPEYWGLGAVIPMRRAIRKLFVETDCSALYGSVRVDNRRAISNLVAQGFKDLSEGETRCVGKIDYIDLLDEKMFIDTVRGGWAGKALYWWGIKSKLEDIPAILPAHPDLPIFVFGDKTIDLTEVPNG